MPYMPYQLSAIIIIELSLSDIYVMEPYHIQDIYTSTQIYRPTGLVHRTRDPYTMSMRE